MPKPSAQKTYRQLVSARAHDATVDPEWMADTLRAIGKSLTEFNADVGKARDSVEGQRRHDEEDPGDSPEDVAQRVIHAAELRHVVCFPKTRQTPQGVFRMSSLLEEAEAILQRRKAERLAAVEDLATRHAAGDTPDPALLVEVTELAGVTLEDYSKKVEHRERRRKQLAAVAQRPDVERQRTEAEQASKDAEGRFKLAQEEFAAAWNPAQAALQAANSTLATLDATKAELRKTCKAPMLVNRSREIANETAAAREREKFLTARQGFLTRELGRLQPQLEDMEERRKHPRIQGDPRTTFVPGDFDPREQTRLQTSVDNMLAELPKVEEALLALPATVAGLQAEQADLLVKAEQSPL